MIPRSTHPRSDYGKPASTKNKRRHEDSDGEEAPTVDLASSSRAAENVERMKETRSCANCVSCVTFVTLEGLQRKSSPESGQSF